MHKLAATTFVQQVEAPTLSIMGPPPARPFFQQATAIKRKSAVIIDNMCKSRTKDAAPFLPKLLPPQAR